MNPNSEMSRYLMSRSREMRGACLRYMVNPQSPNEGRVLRYVMSRNRQTRGYDEPESPNEVACCRYMMNRNRL